jgi:hypothetical protein
VLSSSTNTRPTTIKGISMKCPHCGHSDRLHSDYGAIKSKPGTCHQRNAGAPDCECPGWLPERNKPVRVVSFLRPGDVQRSRARGTGYVSPLDESVEWPEDAA